MKRTEQKAKLALNIIRSPYKAEEGSGNSMSNFYQRYLQDEEAIKEIGGLTYYKIIDLYEFKTKNTSIIAALDNKMSLKIGEVLVDEKGKSFNIISFEMPNITDAVLPEWYSKISFIVLDGNSHQIGNYLAKAEK